MAAKAKKNVGGRPKDPNKQIDLGQLERLMRFRPTVTDTAGFFKVSKRWVQQTIEEKYNMTFTDFREYYMADLKLKLVQIAQQKALSGKDNEMLKYCLNNLCGWAYSPPPRDEGEEIEDMVF